MIALVQGEVLKLRTTRMVYGLLGALLVIVAIGAVALVADTREEVLATQEEQGDLFSTAGTGIIFLLLLGVMLMSGEFRHGTITQTLLITPRRWQVLVAKLVAGGLLGFAYGAIAELFALIVGVPLLQLKGVEFTFGDRGRSLVIGTLLACTLCGMLGVAVGSVIRNQVVAIIVVFASLLIVESIIATATESRWPEIRKFLPGHAISGVIDQQSDTLSRWESVAVLSGYVLVFAGAGGRIVLPRDVNSIQA